MKKNLYIKGMHCIACETLLQREIEAIGCEIKKISHISGLLQAEIKNEKDISKIQKIIKENGYDISTKVENNKPKKITKANIIYILISFLVIGFIALIFKNLNIYKYIPAINQGSSIFLGLLIGIIASLSTCLAVTGGIIVGFTKYIDTTKGRRPRLKVQLLFHSGRIIGFFVLGGLLGLLGKVINISSGFNATFTLFISIILLYMGGSMMGILPNISQLGFHLPKSRTKNIHTQRNPILSPIIGALTFFLPCGFTQSMQLISIGTGSFRLGGTTMAIFAIGTLPVLLGIGMGLGYAKEKYIKLINILVGTVIIYLSIFTISNALNLVKGTSFNGNSLTTQENIQKEIKYQTIYHSHNGFSLEPFAIELKSGNDYKLVIQPQQNGIGCMYSMTIPRLDNNIYSIKKGEDIVFYFHNISPGKYPVVCGAMGMVMGEIQVK